MLTERDLAMLLKGFLAARNANAFTPESFDWISKMLNSVEQTEFVSNVAVLLRQPKAVEAIVDNYIQRLSAAEHPKAEQPGVFSRLSVSARSIFTG